MTEVKREHLAGLEMALESGAVTSPDMRESVRKMIAQASAAHEQEPFGYTNDAQISVLAEGRIANLYPCEGPGMNPIKLYTRPSDEIGRLRAELAESEESVLRVTRERDGARIRADSHRRTIDGMNEAHAKVVQKLADAQDALKRVAKNYRVHQIHSIAKAALLSATAQPADTGCSACACGSTEPHAAALGCIKAAGDSCHGKSAQPAEDKNAARMAYIEEHGAPDSMRQIHPVQGERYWSYDQGETRYPTAAEAIDAARLKPAEVKS